MNELYWITVLGNVALAFTLLASILVFAGFILGLMISSEDDAENRASYVKWLKRTVFVIVLCIIGAIFTPSSKQLYMIYGVGSVIDCVRSSDTAKKLPDKAIEALDKYLDELAKDDKED